MRNIFDNVRRARPLLGTYVEITVAGAAQVDVDSAIDDAYAAIARVHRLMSFHEAYSDVARINREASAGRVAVEDWTFEVLEMAVELNHRSAGMFDITVASTLQKLGLLPHLGDDRSSVGAKTQLGEAIELLPRRCVRFRHPGVRIDLGGIAKGFAVDRAVEILKLHGILSGVVNAGGDLAAFGEDLHPVHVRDPRNPRCSLCQIGVNNEALASTGVRFDPVRCADAASSAVIDPRSGNPVSMISGTTVRAKSCMLADALTKIVMTMGESASVLLDHYRASALLVSADGDIRVTPDWQEALRLAA